MSKNICTLSKWFPSDILEQQDFFDGCKEMETTGSNLIFRISHLSNFIRNNKALKFNHSMVGENEMLLSDIEDMSSALENILKNYNAMFSKFKTNVHSLLANKMKMWQKILWDVKVKLCYCVQDLINNISPLFIQYGEQFLVMTLRISMTFNSLLVLDTISNSDRSIMCHNTCSYLIFPLRKVSVTRLLQLIACNRAELCCHILIDCLLETYRLYDSSDDENGSDNSSLEIYMALTKHMSPPEIPENVLKKDNSPNGRPNDFHNFSNLDDLITYEEKNVYDLLNLALKNTPSILGCDAVKKSKITGAPKLSTKALEKALNYYEEILWGEVGNYLEHVVLWWAASPLSARPPHSSQHLREWIIQFIPSTDVSPVVLSALANLADALGVHVTSTAWDQNFRMALVSSNKYCNADTGKLFSTTLKGLVAQCNQCESTPDWIIGAPLDELPLVEQIPILHRLDHSVHMTRIWAVNESKKLSNIWNVQRFFALINGDIVECLAQLNCLRMRDHINEIQKGNLDVHVEVCALMRAKLVSEVKVNIQKLTDTQRKCIDVLASVCKTICLANLKMIFPPISYWKQAGTEFIPEKPSAFVNKYLNQILVPVLEATDDHVIANMILTLICESWLDHIYKNKILFSHYGACQLLCDFGYIITWLINCPNLGETMRKRLIKNEVLRRCEGVGRLLLRCPGENIKMTDKNKRKMSNSETSEADKNDLMPAEMYVPNQEQWLELRALKKKSLFLLPICCDK